ncbi:MAG: dephospho-CoA kinase [Chloroflexi bacterium RBG_16_68_14]|nr:MAG: dephospho-CoA kinase [Chloroflexi bacterium RBG_16_68_14]
MYVIGLTGGIGSGKTTVARMLAQMGAALLSADRVGHEVYQPGRPAWQEVVDAFGRQVVAANGSIDRRKLGVIVFSDPEQLRRLNAITHPRMKDLMREKLEAERARGARVAVLEAALLFDAGWDDLADEVWVTVAPPEVAARRTAERSGISGEEAMSRIRAQMTNEERIARSQVAIDTDCPLEQTRRQVSGEWERLVERLPAQQGETPPARSGV